MYISIYTYIYIYIYTYVYICLFHKPKGAGNTNNASKRLNYRKTKQGGQHEQTPKLTQA